MSKHRSVNTTRKPQRVIIQSDSDEFSAKIDRQIAHMRSSQSTVRVLCKTFATISTLNSGPLASAYDFFTLAATDDFVSLAQQYNLFRVVGCKLEVFHTNTNVLAPIVISSYHTNGSPLSVQITEESVVDAPDSKFLNTSGDKQNWYWQPRGFVEQSFQDVASFGNFGGFRYFSENSGVNNNNVAKSIITWIVDFRGRR
jgi:hypothetical protein